MAISFKTVGALMCCLLASPVMADTIADDLNSYISINGGIVKEKYACSSANVVGTCMEGWRAGHTGYRLAYGYQFTPTWGLELGYGDLAYAEAHVTTPTPATWSLKAMGWTIAGTATLHLGSSFSLFAKLGGVRAEFKEDLSPATAGTFVKTANTHGIFGAGAQYDITPTVGIRAQYEDFGSYDIYSLYPNQHKVRLTMASGGIVFKF